MCDNPISDISNVASDVGDAASNAANAVAGAVGDGANAVAGAVGDAGNAAANAAADAAKAVGHAAAGVVDGVSHAAQTASESLHSVVSDGVHAAGDLLDGLQDAATSVGSFVADHQAQILTGAEIAANVALDATGVGAVAAAVVSGVIAAGTDAAEGKTAGDALVDGLATGLDHIVPGAGDAAKTVVNGIEHGESAGDIARDAGLQGVGANGGPLLGFAATINSDLAHGKDAGDTIVDLAKQYVSDASGNGAEADPLGPAVLSTIDDVAHGKGLDAVGLDLAKQYMHNAAGGDASPTAQLTDTFFDDMKAGKSLSDTLGDLEHQAEGMAARVDAHAPGGLSGALGNDPSGLGKYGASALGDLAHGKSLEDTAADLGKQAAGDAVDVSGLGDSLKDAVKGAGIDTSALDPLKPYADTALHDLEQGKSLSDTAQDVGKQAAGDLAGDAVDKSGLGAALDGLPHAPAGSGGAIAGVLHEIFGAGAGSSPGSDLAMVEVQSLVGQRQQTTEMTTQLLQSMSDATKSVIDNIGHYADNGAGHGTTGGHPGSVYPGGEFHQVQGAGAGDETTITVDSGGSGSLAGHSAIIPLAHDTPPFHHDFHLAA